MTTSSATPSAVSRGSDDDVHEHVIEQLAAVRLTLRGVEGGLNGGPFASRLRDAIAELDVRHPAAPARLPADASGRGRRVTGDSPIACWRW